jgi:thiol-disulfide isomerase/thioredoxin
MLFHQDEPEVEPTVGGNIFANLSAKPKTGSAAPEFTLTDLKGLELQLNKYKGKAVILNFWAINCAPCIQEIPLLQTISEHDKDNLVVLAINLGDPQKNVETFVKSNKITYHVAAFPVTYFIDRNGIIQDQHTGQLTDGLLPEIMKKIGITTW